MVYLKNTTRTMVRNNHGDCQNSKREQHKLICTQEKISNKVS